VTTFFGTGGLIPTASLTLVPGLTTTVNVTAGETVYVAADGGIQNSALTAGAFSVTDVVVQVDGAFVTNGVYRRVMCSNPSTGINSLCTWSLSGVVPLSPGSHQLQVVASASGGAGTIQCTISGDGNSVLQGEFTVMILKG
jgi:hypothetical protein